MTFAEWLKRHPGPYELLPWQKRLVDRLERQRTAAQVFERERVGRVTLPNFDDLEVLEEADDRTCHLYDPDDRVDGGYMTWCGRWGPDLPECPDQESSRVPTYCGTCERLVCEECRDAYEGRDAD